MANEARLNLVITAQDQAKAVIEEMVNSLKSAFDGIKQSADSTVQGFRNMAEGISQASSQMGQDMNQISQHAQHMSESMDFMNLQMAGEMIQQVGEQITGFFEDAVSSAADFDQNIVNTTASLNANMGAVKLTKEQIQQMQDAAIKMGESGFYSANQVSEAMNTMSRNGLTYQQIMSGGIDTVYKVAAANQSDIEQTANVVSDIYNEMGDVFRNSGMTAQQAADQIGNSMTVAMHHARISMDDFMNAMKYVGPEASAMGVGVKDVSALISTLGQHAIRGSQAGTTLRTMFTNLTPTTKEAADEMQKLGMITKDGSNIFFDASGKMKPMAEVQQLLHDKLGALNPQMQEMAIKTIFGRYALSGMTAIVDTAPSKFQGLTQAMNNNNTMTDIMKEKSTGLGMEIQKLNSHWETIKKTIGEALKPIIESLMSGLNKLMKAWEGLSPGVQKAIIVIAAVTGVVLLVGGALLNVIGTIGMFAIAFEAALPVLAAIAGPVAIVIGIIAALGFVAYEVYKHWDQIKGWLSSAWNAIKNTASTIFNGITSFFKQWGTTLLAVLVPVIGIPILIAQHWSQIKTFASQIFNEAINAIKNVWNGAISWIKGAGQAFANAIVSGWNSMVNSIKNIWNGVVSWVKGAAQAFANAIVNAFNWMYNHNYYFQDLVDFIKNAWNTIKKDATAIWNGIVTSISIVWKVIQSDAITVWNTLTSWLTNAWNTVVSVAQTTWNGFVNILTTVWNTISSIAQAFWNREVSGLENTWNQIVSVARTVWNGLTSFFSSLWSGISSGVSSAWNGIVSTISSLVNGAINAVKGPFNNLEGFFSGLWGQAEQWGENLINMMANGIKNAAGAVGNAVKSVASNIAGFLGFHSPTKEGPGSDADTWMPNMVNMFTKGVQEHAPKLQMAIGNVALGLKTGITSVSNTVQQNRISIPQTRANQGGPTIYINIDGRSAKTDNDLAETIAHKIYRQMPVVS